MANIAIIPAAGNGSRMRAGVNKQYLFLDGAPILARTLTLFEQHPRIDRICLVSPLDEIDYCRDQIVAPYGFTKVAAIVSGGATRQDSVRNGLHGCNAAEDDLILIHDGVRPFVTAAQIEALLVAATASGAALLGVPVKETIKRVVDQIAVETPERSHLWLAQTPQVFRYGLICAAHAQAAADDFSGTDDASLVERLNRPVTMVEGSYANLKITTPEDLVIARALLAAQGESA